MNLEETNLGGIQRPDQTRGSQAGTDFLGESDVASTRNTIVNTRPHSRATASRSVLGSQLVLLRMLPLHPELCGGGRGGFQAGDQALPLGAHFKSQFLSCHVWVMTSLCLCASLSLRPKGGGAASRCHCSGCRAAPAPAPALLLGPEDRPASVWPSHRWGQDTPSQPRFAFRLCSQDSPKAAAVP